MRLELIQFVTDTPDAAILSNLQAIVGNDLTRIDGLHILATTSGRWFVALHGERLVTFWVLKLGQSIFSSLATQRLLQLWFDLWVVCQFLLLLIILLKPFSPKIRFSIVGVLFELGEHVVQHTESSLALLFHHDIFIFLDLGFVLLKYLLRQLRSFLVSIWWIFLNRIKRATTFWWWAYPLVFGFRLRRINHQVLPRSIRNLSYRPLFGPVEFIGSPSIRHSLLHRRHGLLETIEQVHRLTAALPTRFLISLNPLNIFEKVYDMNP